ncbi:endosialidase [Synechococcus phage S-B05]|nr:endosialidase [Synechococcus phage S-B05]
MSRIRANNIVNGAGTGAPTFPNGAVISGIATINADIDSNSNITVNQITSLQSLGVGTGATVTNPADNELAFNTNGTERVRVDSSGNVGINTTPSYALDVNSAAIQIGNSTDAFIQYKSTAGNWHAGAHSDNALVFYSGTYGTGTEKMRLNSAGNLVFPSGQGIDFSATGDGSGVASSELFDDYEEGSWSPIFADSSGAQASQTYSVQRGRYVKVGRHLTCTFDVQLSAKGTFGGSYIILGGLPYSTTQGSNCGGTLTIGYYSGFSLPAQANVINGYVNSGNVYIMTPRDANGSDYLTTGEVSQINNDSRLIGTINIMLDV